MYRIHKRNQANFFDFAAETDMTKMLCNISVGNPRDQMTKCTDFFFTSFSSPSGRSS